jgi:transposase-like protein
MTERAAPFYCPYCGDEDLRPSEEGHGAWECRACNRAFQLKFLGLLAEGFKAAGSRAEGSQAEGSTADSPHGGAS